MIYNRFFLKFFFFVFFVPLTWGTGSQYKNDNKKNSSLLRRTSILMSQTVSPNSNHNIRESRAKAFVEPSRAPTSKGSRNSKRVKGIILAFNDWPEEEEKILILKETEKLGLTKKKVELSFAKVWFFEWTNGELRNTIKAYGICVKISKKFSLKYCRSEYKSIPKI